MSTPVRPIADADANPTVKLLRQFTSEPRLVDWPLSPDDYRDVAIVLRAVMGGTVGTGQDTFRIPTTHNLVLWGIRGHIAMDDPNGANDALMTYGGVALTGKPSEALLQRASNIRLDLQNSDRGEKLIEGRSVALSDILKFCGGEKLDFSKAPHIVPGGQTVQMDLVAKVATAATQGGNFEAGVILEGTYVRCREG